MIEVRNIRKRFGGVEAVSSLSFAVKGGEIFGIVGPDGAGKSTLLRLMAGILLPDDGGIEIAGVKVRRNPFIIKENLAYMPQRFGLYEDLTVEENIRFSAGCSTFRTARYRRAWCACTNSAGWSRLKTGWRGSSPAA